MTVIIVFSFLGTNSYISQNGDDLSQEHLDTGQSTKGVEMQNIAFRYRATPERSEARGLLVLGSPPCAKLPAIHYR